MGERDGRRAGDDVDARVRAALMTLRADAGAVPLADPRFVRARGQARRRRRLSAVVAAGAAAVLAMGFGMAAGLRGEEVLPALPTPSPSVGPEELLPTSQDWRAALDVSETVLVRDVTGGTPTDAPLGCSALNPAGELRRSQVVHGESSGLKGSQSAYRYADPAAIAAEEVGSSRRCPGLALLEGAPEGAPGAAVGSPLVHRVGRPDGTSQWRVLAWAGPNLAYLTVEAVGPAAERTGIQRLAEAAQRRIGQEAAPTTEPTTLPSTEPPTTPSTTDAPPPAEDMPVAGTRPLLPSSLFVPATSWASPELTAGAATHAVTTDFEGSADIADCDPDDAVDGTAQAGRFGIVAVAVTTDGRFVGKQRVRLVDDADGEAERLLAGFRGCRVPDVTVTPQPGEPDVLRVVRAGDDAVTWVGVTTHATREAVTTVMLRAGTATDGAAEVARLLALARQR